MHGDTVSLLGASKIKRETARVSFRNGVRWGKSSFWKERRKDAQVLAVSGGDRVNGDAHLDGGRGERAGKGGGAEGVAEGETERSDHRLVLMAEKVRDGGERSLCPAARRVTYRRHGNG